MALVKRKFLVVRTFDIETDKEISLFLRDMDKSEFTGWIHKHVTWAYSNGYGVQFEKATDEEVEQLKSNFQES